MSNIDVTKSLIWQYNEAENLQALIEKKQEWIELNHNQFWSDWYRDIFDLRTANDFGLSVWAIILGVDFGVKTSDGSKAVFGFDPYGANFFDGTFSAVAGTTQLSTEDRRLILQLRYFKLTSRCTIPEINYALKSVLGDSWVLDPGNMKTSYIVFGGIPGAKKLYILQNFDVIPRSSAVGYDYRFNVNNAFGFSPFGMNFHQAVFPPVF